MRSFGSAERVGSVSALLGEGPRWDADAEELLWVDIHGETLHVGERSIACGAKVCAAAPWRPGIVLVALADALASVRVAGGRMTRLASIPHGRPGMRCNDGACDAAGRFWIGTMAEDLTPGAGALYRYDPDGELRPVIDGVTLSNGLDRNASARLMYHIDSPTQRIDVLDYDLASGTVANRRPFAVVPDDDGLPDGLAVDDEGGVWVAIYGGGEVRRFSPDGSVSGRVEVPAPEVTACCFAGNRLYLTTAGGLFALDVPYTGPPARSFGGRELRP